VKFVSERVVEFWILWCFREKVVFMGYYGRNPGKIDDFGIDGV
jgi:hypothetical protein